MESKGLADVIAPLAVGAQASGAVLSGVGAYNKSVADKAAYAMQATVADTNAGLADAQARDAIARGQVTEFNSTLKARQLKGQQVASMAASGLDLSTGSPLSVLTDTDVMSASDAAVIRRNALKEAYGFDIQAANYRDNASLLKYRSDMESPGKAAATSLLTGAGKVAASWYNTRKAGAGVS